MGSFSCLKAREREQRKEEEDNITTVVKRSKRRVTRMCGCGWGVEFSNKKREIDINVKNKAPFPLPNFC